MLLPSPWRADFPALVTLDRQGHTYLDNAATTQKPQAMLDALQCFYGAGTANVHRAQHQLGVQTTTAFETTRQAIAQWLNAESAQQIVFTHGATSAFNLLAFGLEHELQAGDHIVISALEHHANLLPWQRLAARRQAQLVVLPLTADGVVDMLAAKTLIGPRTRVLAISQLSNVFGTHQPLNELLPLAQAHGALTVVDGAQGIVHSPQDLQALGCDFYVFSSHKLYGPEGVGVLYGRKHALERLKHWQLGGEMVHSADYQYADFRPAPLGFEAGTPPIAGVIALGASLAYLQAQDMTALRQHEQALHGLLLEGLSKIVGVSVLGNPDAALVSFTVDGAHPADVAQLLSEQSIAVRGGQHCAMPLMKRLAIPGAIRASLAIYNDSADLERFFIALERTLAVLQ